jgi:DtxR family transcriptional regulator, Mn-dependent transcriptional regulator
LTEIELDAHKLTHAVEDYLKAIYSISSIHERATTSLLAEELDVQPASVTGMVKRLAQTKPALVNYERHRGVVLTRAGEKIALKIIRQHRLLEMFLHQTLGFPLDEVHAEADRLEHVISDNFEERISDVLGDPTHDPHGHPIPNRDLEVQFTNLQQLGSLRAGDVGIVARVADKDPEVLKHLEALGLIPNTRFSVLDFSEFDGILTVKIAGQNRSISVGERISKIVFVNTDLGF